MHGWQSRQAEMILSAEQTVFEVIIRMIRRKKKDYRMDVWNLFGG